MRRVSHEGSTKNVSHMFLLCLASSLGASRRAEAPRRGDAGPTPPSILRPACRWFPPGARPEPALGAPGPSARLCCARSRSRRS